MYIILALISGILFSHGESPSNCYFLCPFISASHFQHYVKFIYNCVWQTLASKESSSVQSVQKDSKKFSLTSSSFVYFLQEVILWWIMLHLIREYSLHLNESFVRLSTILLPPRPPSPRGLATLLNQLSPLLPTPFGSDLNFNLLKHISNNPTPV